MSELATEQALEAPSYGGRPLGDTRVRAHTVI